MSTRFTPSMAVAAIEFVEAALAEAKMEWPAMHRALTEYRGELPSGGYAVIGRSSDVSDPTARCAIGPDQFARDMQTAARSLASMVAAARELDIVRRRARPARDGRPVPKLCKNIHGCPAGKYADSGRKGRCEACDRYQRRHGGADRVTAKMTLLAV